MTLLVVCSAKGSPGVTTLACAMAAVWPKERTVLIAECDPSGGDIAARFELSTKVGMASLVLAQRQGSCPMPELETHLQHLPGGLGVLAGPATADSAMVLDHELSKYSVRAFTPDVDVVVDCGRVIPNALGQRRLMNEADHIVVATRCDAASILHARSAISWIAMLGVFGVASMVLVGDGPFSVDEASAFVDKEVDGAVPYDPVGAAGLCGIPVKARTFSRSTLIRSSRRIVDRVVCHVSSEETQAQCQQGVASFRTDKLRNQITDSLHSGEIAIARDGRIDDLNETGYGDASSDSHGELQTTDTGPA